MMKVKIVPKIQQIQARVKFLIYIEIFFKKHFFLN